jgi:hypothetical protein
MRLVLALLWSPGQSLAGEMSKPCLTQPLLPAPQGEQVMRKHELFCRVSFALFGIELAHCNCSHESPTNHNALLCVCVDAAAAHCCLRIK